MGIVYDHEGNMYESKKKMLEEYGISENYFNKRIRNGCSLEEALTKPVKKQKVSTVYDHAGRAYKDTMEMCAAYGISIPMFQGRLKRKWSLEEALTTPKLTTPANDPKYKNKAAYDDLDAEADIDELLMEIRNAFDASQLREILEKKKKKSKKRPGPKFPCKDHRGNHFDSMRDMCEAYGQSLSLYRHRTTDGWPISYALEKPAGDYSCTDFRGRKFANIAKMCNYYSIDKIEFKARMDEGWTLYESLTLPTDTDDISEQ